jgi:hypothetical protein
VGEFILPDAHDGAVTCLALSQHEESEVEFSDKSLLWGSEVGGSEDWLITGGTDGIARVWQLRLVGKKRHTIHIMLFVSLVLLFLLSYPNSLCCVLKILIYVCAYRCDQAWQCKYSAKALEVSPRTQEQHHLLCLERRPSSGRYM